MCSAGEYRIRVRRSLLGGGKGARRSQRRVSILHVLDGRGSGSSYVPGACYDVGWTIRTVEGVGLTHPTSTRVIVVQRVAIQSSQTFLDVPLRHGCSDCAVLALT